MSKNGKGKPEPDVAISAEGVLVQLPELAKILGVSHQSIRNYIAAGCPVAVKGGRGKAYSFDTARVIYWLNVRAARHYWLYR
jgi:phage terminase Nu1 subunit (DNA packaging protein)